MIHKKKLASFTQTKMAILVGVAALFFTSAGGANAAITQDFTATTGCGAQGGNTITDCGTSGGQLIFQQTGLLQLQVTLDNTSLATLFSDGSRNSAAITGFVANITDHIDAFSSWTMVDGTGTDITSYWGLTLDNTSSISNSTFDLVFDAGNVNGGIYNDEFSSLIDISGNVFPDIAILTINIQDPDPFSLTSIDNDTILRMQRVGIDGDGSLKIVTSSTSSNGGISSSGSTVSEPGVLALLGLGLLAQGGLMFRRRSKQLKN